jgi:hypothetical protein
MINATVTAPSQSQKGNAMKKIVMVLGAIAALATPAEAADPSMGLDLNGVARCIDLLGGSVSGQGPQIGDFNHLYPKLRQGLQSLPEMKGFKGDYKFINDELKKAGFTIQLPPSPPASVSVAAIIKIGFEWKFGGKEDEGGKPLVTKGKPAFLVQGGLSFRQGTKEDKPIVRAETKSGDVVAIWQLDARPRDGFLLNQMATYIVSDEPKPAIGWSKGEVVLPFVKLDIQPDLSWLVGASTRDGAISAALQQVRFSMDPLGGKYESATAVTATRSISMPPRRLVIDGGFVIALKRVGMQTPAFVVYVGEDDWKK